MWLSAKAVNAGIEKGREKFRDHSPVVPYSTRHQGLTTTPPPTSDAKETRPRDADSSGVSSPLHPLGFLLHSPFLNPELTPVSLRKS